MANELIEKFEELCDEHSESYLTYDNGTWFVYINLNINHGISDASFEGEDLNKVLTEALEWQEEEE